MLQDDKAMFLFGDDDENYQEQSLTGRAPARGANGVQHCKRTTVKL